MNATAQHELSVGPRTEGDPDAAQKRPSKPPSRSNTTPNRVNPAGGLASAITGSGLALANPAMQRAIVPPVPAPPVPTHTNQTSRHRHNSAASDMGNSASLVPDRHAQSRQSTMNHHQGHYGEETSSLIGSESSGSEEEEDSSQDDLDSLALDSIAPVTGFAVASNKRTADFHALFPSVPEGDYLIDDYGCALQREILIQGRLYISENHICFHANIFGWTTNLVIPIEDITSIEKRMTAYVIPNAIQITTYNAKYTFASLLSRDTTYDVIYNIWRSVTVRPEAPPSPRVSIDDQGSNPVSMGSVAEGMAGPPLTIPPAVEKRAVTVRTRKATQCACGKEGKHYSELAMDTVIPGEPDKIYNLMFASGFIKDFMRNDEKLMDIQISDWTPISPDSKLLKRNMSYIKPLTGSIGPKQTKCEIQDEMLHLDFEEYISMLTTTRTPDVPSGGVFSVKTRTCLTWAGVAATRVLVTTQVEWTGRSFIKGIIERSCLDGQKTYHSSLERSMRRHIAENISEFVPQGFTEEVEGVIAAIPTPEERATVPPLSPLSEEEARKAKEKERNARGLQWALDTAEGAGKVASQSFWGAIELVQDAWESSETTTILWFAVVFLLLSNIWTWSRAGRVVLDGPRVHKSVIVEGTVSNEEMEKVVGRSVREAFRVFEEMMRGEQAWVEKQAAHEEVIRETSEILKGLEERIKRLEGKAGLTGLD